MDLGQPVAQAVLTGRPISTPLSGGTKDAGRIADGSAGLVNERRGGVGYGLDRRKEGVVPCTTGRGSFDISFCACTTAFRGVAPNATPTWAATTSTTS